VPGWCVEVKRHARAARADIRGWWAQAARQADTERKLPVLFYRLDRDEWRAVWPVAWNWPCRPVACGQVMSGPARVQLMRGLCWPVIVELKMIDGLVSGKLYGCAQSRTGQSGTVFVTAKVRASVATVKACS